MDSWSGTGTGERLSAMGATGSPSDSISFLGYFLTVSPYFQDQNEKCCSANKKLFYIEISWKGTFFILVLNNGRNSSKTFCVYYIFSFTRLFFLTSFASWQGKVGFAILNFLGQDVGLQAHSAIGLEGKVFNLINGTQGAGHGAKLDPKHTLLIGGWMEMELLENKDGGKIPQDQLSSSWTCWDSIPRFANHVGSIAVLLGPGCRSEYQWWKYSLSFCQEF